jgi:hypothetical protein
VGLPKGNSSCYRGLVASDDDLSERIYAINISGVGHWFVNVVKVNNNDIPTNVDGIFTSTKHE